MAAYITVGAKTSHGGTAISGSPNTTHNGISKAASILDLLKPRRCAHSYM